MKYIQFFFWLKEPRLKLLLVPADCEPTGNIDANRSDELSYACNQVAHPHTAHRRGFLEEAVLYCFHVGYYLLIVSQLSGGKNVSPLLDLLTMRR
jgi:hypothetical protein